MSMSPIPAKVLLVEDNPINQAVAIAMLKKLGCSVDVAENGLRAVEMAGQSDYHIVIMDCMMPVMDGYQATVEIRRFELSAGGRVPIVALTANATTYDRPRCLEAGMDDYMTKPVSIEALYTMLYRWVGVSESAAAG